MPDLRRSLVCFGLPAAFVLFAGTGSAEVLHPTPTRPPGGPVASPIPLTPEARAVMDVRAEGQRQVMALLAEHARVTDAAARTAIMRRVSESKRATEVRVVRLHAEQARTRGDLAAVLRLEALARAIEAPMTPIEAQSAAVRKPAPVEGRQP